ncbi:MAG: hypothetical protein PHY47_00395 [Lachnospiraceae bacterium]|nr:hypothetical protein [Lachnospiraceae bacterium]
MKNGFNCHLNESLTPEQIGIKNEYIKSLTEGAFLQREFAPSSINKNTSLNGFITLVKEAIDRDQKEKKNKIIFIDEYAKVNKFENPHKPGEDARAIVSYSLNRRAPGTTAGGNTPFDKSRREIKPQFRGVGIDEIKAPGQITFYSGQWFDNLICFHIYARSNKEANDIADWFEELMECNRQFFAWNGILKYHFEERESDAVVKDGDNAIHLRPMVYWVRTEKCYEITEQAINNIVLLLTTI